MLRYYCDAVYGNAYWIKKGKTDEFQFGRA